ncbi:hypothetical protein A0H81_06891 [Grifola frondosa]|uniref:Uncharacterized protein n=1 Tax=Grifola frondosa TaxID=5627 RepID=A0A1C7M8F1_GRIFR|nr:hypothetical protein A0H81_06891 [Grifola frondosa]
MLICSLSPLVPICTSLLRSTNRTNIDLGGRRALTRVSVFCFIIPTQFHTHRDLRASLRKPMVSYHHIVRGRAVGVSMCHLWLFELLTSHICGAPCSVTRSPPQSWESKADGPTHLTFKTGSPQAMRCDAVIQYCQNIDGVRSTASHLKRTAHSTPNYYAYSLI